MEINGKEFMRNVSIEQDKDRLLAEHEKLEQMKRDTKMRDENYANNNAQNDSSAYVDLSINNTPTQEEPSENVIQDIMLEPEDPNKTKKKYIVLGFGLILLFIITILVIRLISNNETKVRMEAVNSDTKEVATDKILDKIDTNEEYQKVIDRKIALDEAAKLDKEKKTGLEINIPAQTDVAATPIVIEKPKKKVEPKRDLFGLDKEKTEKKVITVKEKNVVQAKITTQKIVPVKKTVVKKTTSLGQPKKKIVVEPAKQTNFTLKNTAISGYFIQIGAYTKAPSKAFLNGIANKGYRYKVHKMTIKGKVYNKILIGEYPSRGTALKVIEKIRKDFKNPKAYILKF